MTKSTAKDDARPGKVRIVGGQWKRTPIPVPAIAGLRPTPDRVRETIFNWLTHLRPDFAQLRGLDLFAGTGALGFELMSRGAAAVLLVEKVASLRGQLLLLKERLGAQQIEVRGGDALVVAKGLPPASFDVIFLDPPFAAPDALLWPALECSARLLAPDGLIYVESDSPFDEARLQSLGLALVRSARAGRVSFGLLARAAS